jgi:hypothetical protein
MDMLPDLNIAENNALNEYHTVPLYSTHRVHLDNRYHSNSVEHSIFFRLHIDDTKHRDHTLCR